METPLTSEEKLLRLIRQKDKGSTSFPNNPKKDERVKSTSKGFSLPAIDFLILTNRLLIIVCLGIFAYLLTKYFFVEKKPMPTTLSSIEKTKEDNVSPKVIKPDVKPLAIYQQTVSARDIFELPWEKETVTESADPSTSQDLSQQIKVVGIMLDRDPKAIIEEISSAQTFFMSKGEHVGNAVVEDIQEDKVIFIYNNKKVELAP